MLFLLVTFITLYQTAAATESDELLNRSRRFDFSNIEPEDAVNTGCPSGQILHRSTDSCIVCNPGTYANDDVCTPCPLGTYQDASESSECVLCPEGLSTLQIGARNEGECVGLRQIERPRGPTKLRQKKLTVLRPNELTVLRPIAFVRLTERTCQLPEEVHSGTFWVDGQEMEPGSSVPLGSTVELICDGAHVVGDADSLSMECDGTTVLRNECYQTLIEPDTSELVFVGEEVQFTCRVKTTHDIYSFQVWSQDYPNSIVRPVSEKTFEGGFAEQTFSYRASEIGSIGAVHCRAEIEMGETAVVSREKIIGIVGMGVTGTEEAFARQPLKITAWVTDNNRLDTDFSWLKDGEDVLAISDHVEDGRLWSEVIFDSAVIEDTGSYTVTITVRMWEMELSRTLNFDAFVKGFSVEPEAANGENPYYYIEGEPLEEIQLSCVYHGLEDDQQLKWWADPVTMDVFHDDWQTVEEVDDHMTRSTIVFGSWPEIPGDHLACGVLEDGAWVDESHEGITIRKLDYAIEMGSDVEGRPNEEVQLTCTASAPESLEHPPTVTWFRDNAHSDDHLEDGPYFITNSVREEAEVISTLTIMDFSSNDVGQYSCLAQYVEPTYIEVYGKSFISVTEAAGGCDASTHEVENGKIKLGFEQDGMMIYEVECDSGYWLSEESSPYLYCNTEEELVVPNCERVTIDMQLVAYDDYNHIIRVSYDSPSWNGAGLLCDDGWDNREAEMLCRQNGFKFGRALSLTSESAEFVLTELNCPCSETDQTDFCSARRYEDHDGSSCDIDEVAGLHCYNETADVRSVLLKSSVSKKKNTMLFKVQVFKFGDAISMHGIDRSSFTVNIHSSEQKMRKFKVKTKGDSVLVELVTKKKQNILHPDGDCVTFTLRLPFSEITHDIVHCFE